VYELTQDRRRFSWIRDNWYKVLIMIWFVGGWMVGCGLTLDQMADDPQECIHISRGVCR
jgi:hypothetical protein